MSPASTRTAYPFATSLVDPLVIPGAHNRENATAAIAAVQSFRISDEVVRQGLAAFTGLPHRLKFVREVGGVRYYDDSISTTPGSAIAALRSFDQPKTIILGGSEKGATYDEVASTCAAVGAQVVAIGATGAAIAALCRERQVTVYEGGSDMSDIVATAARHTPSGGVVLLSPASASFDMFASYGHRGDRFIAAVQAL